MKIGISLSLLTSGQIGKQTKLAGIGAGEATSFLTGKLQDVVEERLRTLTGVDRFQVEPYVSSTTGTVGPRVTVSKRLIGEKLFVTYANLLGTTEEQVIKIEYLLNKNVSLVGVRDEKGKHRRRCEVQVRIQMSYKQGLKKRRQIRSVRRHIFFLLFFAAVYCLLFTVC